MNEVKQTDRLHSDILASITDALFAVDDNWRFTYVNKEAQLRFRRTEDELLGRSLWAAWQEPGKIRTELEQAKQEQITVSFEVFVSSSGSWYSVHAYPASEGLVVCVRDISEKKGQERETARLDRLNLVGEMAAGIAHEIRNPMTTVRGFLQFLRRRFAGCEEEVDIMMSEIDRANSIISVFLALAKNKATARAGCDLNQVIKSLYPLIQAEASVAGKKALLELAEPVETLADQNEVRQMILNLSMNGLEAMQPGGTLTLRTGRTNSGAIISVQDEGSGIKPDILEKLGTPFFTTKAEATGLGLAVCYSIAARHDASIHIATGITGTTISVLFQSA